MMSDIQVRALLEAQTADRRLVVEPLLDPTQIGPASLDLRLGSEFTKVRRSQQGVLDPSSRPHQKSLNVAFGNELIIHPGQFLLACTLEYLRLPLHVGGQILSRASWARNGLQVVTAMTVPPGFTGTLTLELANRGTVPLKLLIGTRICQLVLWELGQETSRSYGDQMKYDMLPGPQPPLLSPEVDEQKRIVAVGTRFRGPLPSSGEN